MISHKKLAHWYAQLGQHLESGIPLAEALQFCEGPPAEGRRAMAERLQNGDSPGTVLREAPKWLPRADRDFLTAAAETGNLPGTLHKLSERHNQVGATQLKVILGLLYPLGVFHIAALILPLVRMIDYETGFKWDASSYAVHLLILLLPVWVLLGFIYTLARSDHPLLPRLLRCLPLLRKYSKMQALADFCYALGTLIGAGVPAPDAWRLSGRIVNDNHFQNAVKKLEPIFASGGDPGGTLADFTCFPPEFCAFYRTGAESGHLDSNLVRAGHHFQEKANNAMTVAALLYPSLIFIAVAGFIVVSIFQVYSGYLQIFDQF